MRYYHKILNGIIVVLAVLVVIKYGVALSKTSSSQPSTPTATASRQVKTSEKPSSSSTKRNETPSKPQKETQPVTTATEASLEEESYDSNPYYDVVEEATLENILGHTEIIHKVFAKEDASFTATAIAYDSNNNVVGKATDTITLTKGEYNYFHYTFSSNVEDSTLDVTASLTDNYLEGPRHFVEMVASNISGDHLFITFKQLTDSIGSFAKYKILYYKDDKIIEAKENYFSGLSVNLQGIGSTDVADIWLLGNTDFDRFECYFEP